MSPEDIKALSEFLANVQSIVGTQGMVAGIGFALYGFVRILRLRMIQDALPEKARWKAWPKWVAMLVVFALSAGGTALTAIAAPGSIPWYLILTTSIIAGLVAMGTDAGLSTTPLGGPKSDPPQQLVPEKMIPADMQSIKVPFPPTRPRGFCRADAIFALLLITAIVGVIYVRAAGAIAITASQDNYLNNTAGVRLNAVSCTAVAANRWTGWIQVDSQQAVSFDVDLAVNVGAPAYLEYRCETTRDNTTVADAGRDLPVIVSSATTGVSTLVPSGIWRFVSATGGAPGTFSTTTRVGNIPAPYLNCQFTCGAGANADDTISVWARGLNP